MKQSILIQLIGVALCVLVLSACSVTKKSVMSFSPNSVIAHRGAFKKNNFPENSIASLREAIRLGCTGSEFDVRMTADSVLVICHDPVHGGLAIETSTYQDLKKIPLKNGEELPTLKQYLLAGKKNNATTRLVLEIKPSPSGKERGQLIAERVVEMVRQCGVEKITEYISFDFAILKRVQSLQPSALTHYLNGEKAPDEIKKEGISGIDYNISVFRKNPDWIKQAKALGLILNVWTVNDPDQLEWCINQSFDFITTNEPEYLLERLKK
ncbi:MAG: hypothetical protein RLZ11_188 [Bacteroidota bacterium]|jgi:glycerophosphoryl diester phosphodiesterase